MREYFNKLTRILPLIIHILQEPATPSQINELEHY